MSNLIESIQAHSVADTYDYCACSPANSFAASPVFNAYRVREACSLLTISPASLYRLAKAGKVTLVKIGGRTVVPQAEVVRLLSGEGT